MSGTQNNFQALLGMQFTVGASNMTVYSLGRWVFAGNSQSHLLRLVDNVTGYGVPGGAVSLNTAGQVAGQFAYATLPTPVVLQAGHTYFVASDENLGGDIVGDNGWHVTTTTDGVATSASYANAANSPDGFLTWYNNFGTTNFSYGPYNFTYTLGGTPSNTIIGSPFPMIPSANARLAFLSIIITFTTPALPGNVVGKVISGTVTLGMILAGGVGGTAPLPPNNTMTVQFLVDGRPAPGVAGQYRSAPTAQTTPFFTMSWDTTTVPDGTHVISFRCVDLNMPGSLCAFNVWGACETVIVNNTASLNTNAQTIPMTLWNGGGSGPEGILGVRPKPQLPEFIPFPGASSLPFHNTVYPYPIKTVPSVAGNPAYRDGLHFYSEQQQEPTTQEYEPDNLFFTTQSGGVFGQSFIAQTGALQVEVAYPSVVRSPSFDGGRLDSKVTPYTTFVEFPLASQSSTTNQFWVGADLVGGVKKFAYDGQVTTLCGYTDDRSVLQLDWTDETTSEDTGKTIVGTIGSPSFGDFHGMNDLCFDPRDSTGNTLFVVKTVDHIIIKITNLLSGSPTAVRYAGTDGVSGYTGDGGSPLSAKLNTPYGICIQNVSGQVDPIGTLYIADTYNNAIRKISADGSTITTLFGKQPCPSTPVIQTPNTYNMNPGGSLSWSSATIGTITGYLYTNTTGGITYGILAVSSAIPFSMLVGDTITGTGISAGTTVGALITSTAPYLGDGTIPSGGLTTYFVNNPQTVGSSGSPITITVTGGRGVVVVPETTSILGLNYWVAFSGATNTGTADINASGTNFIKGPQFIVTSFTDSQHFTIGLPTSAVIGTYGTIGFPGGSQIGTFNLDTYSSPIPITAANAYCPNPIMPRLTSTGDLVVGETSTGLIRRYTFANANPVARVGSGNGLYTWGTGVGYFSLDVDPNGVCGPVDDIATAPGLDDYARINANTPGNNILIPHFAAEAPNIAEGGNGTATGYPWNVTFSRYAARLIFNGVSFEGSPNNWRALSASDPYTAGNSGVIVDRAYGNPDGDAPGGGQEDWERGSVRLFPWCSRPSFELLVAYRGCGHLMGDTYPSFDRANNTLFPSTTPGDAGDQALAAYIQGGWGGTCPRPEITGNNLRDVIYFIRRSTLKGSAVGSGSNGVNYGTTVVQAGPSAVDTTPPLITGVSAVRLNARSLQVNCMTDKPALCYFAVGTSYDTGFQHTNFPSTGTTTQAAYNIFSPFEQNYTSGPHLFVADSITSTAATLHYTVVAKDLAGNFSYYPDQTAPAVPALSVDGAVLENGSAGSLSTAYGVFTFEDLYAPAPPGRQFPNDRFFTVLLNGRPTAAQGQFQRLEVHAVTAAGDPLFGQLNIFGISFDDIWFSFSNYLWVFNNGSPPAPNPNYTPTQNPGGGTVRQLPTAWNPPYTTSGENAFITGGTGSLTTEDGVWTFGAVSGSGWMVQLNGIPVAKTNNPDNILPATKLQVASRGCMFALDTSAQWHVWTGHTWSLSTGPTNLPIPKRMRFSPIVGGVNVIQSEAAISHTAPAGTFIAQILIETSYGLGYGFSGTLSVTDNIGDNIGGISGTNLVVGTGTLAANNGYTLVVTATMNGASYGNVFNLGTI
jgi:hypothetical protein